MKENESDLIHFDFWQKKHTLRIISLFLPMMSSLSLFNPFLTLLFSLSDSVRCVHLHREKKFICMACSLSGERGRQYAIECIEKREKTYTILLLWNKRRTDGGKVF